MGGQAVAARRRPVCRSIRGVKLRLLAFTGILLAGCAARSGIAPATRSAISDVSVRAHMSFLASDALNGRGSGTHDEWVTATYVAAHFRRLGLTPFGAARELIHEVQIERSELSAPPTLRAGARTFTHAKEILVTSFAASRLSGPLQKYQAGVPVKPQSVLLIPPVNPPNAAETAGAALVLSRETAPQQKRRLAGSAAPGPALRMQWIVGTPRRGAVALDEASYQAIAALADGTELTLQAEARPAVSARTWNVVGQLPGRGRPNELIVLSAHHDHVGTRNTGSDGANGSDNIFNGADDDASGTIAVLGLAEALSRSRLERTLVFATFGSEETGGQGSSHFIDASGINLSHVVANLQFEMIGRPDSKVPSQTLWLTGYERSDLGEALARHGARLVADPHPEQSFFTRSDNIRFARRGVIAHTVSSYGMHTDYHEPSDEIDTIDFAHMTRAIQSMVAPVRWLANSDFTPQWKAGMRP
jgi:hypothetical protein